jgi:hypothetical protein
MQAILQTESLRRKSPLPGKIVGPDQEVTAGKKLQKTPKIRCPHCHWQPDGKPYWQCEICFTVFDTFQTRAHCPNRLCGNSWQDTQCILCGVLSPHEKWYESNG